MRTTDLRAHHVWFAFGTWVGSVACIFLEPIILRPTVSHPMETLLGPALGHAVLCAGYIFVAALIAAEFVGWIAVRRRLTGVQCDAPWAVTWIFGFIYLPCLFGLIPLLIKITGQGQGAIIGSAIMVCFFGLPVLLAEVLFQIGAIRISNDPYGN